MHQTLLVCVSLAQVHRSSRGEQQTKVDLAGTLEAQRSAKMLIESIISQPSKSYSKGNLSILTSTCMYVYTYTFSYRKSGNFCCENIFVVDGSYEN